MAAGDGTACRCGGVTVWLTVGLNTLSIAGLVYDIIGAILLAEAIVRTPLESLMRQAHPGGGEFSSVNLALFGALEDQRHDARFGLSLLVLGFVLQLLAACGVVVSLHWYWLVVFIAALVGIIVAWKILSSRLARSRRMRVANSLDGIEQANFLARNPEEPEG